MDLVQRFLSKRLSMRKKKDGEEEWGAEERIRNRKREEKDSFPTLALPIKVSVRFGSLILPRASQTHPLSSWKYKRTPAPISFLLPPISSFSLFTCFSIHPPSTRERERWERRVKQNNSTKLILCSLWIWEERMTQIINISSAYSHSFNLHLSIKHFLPSFLSSFSLIHPFRW